MAGYAVVTNRLIKAMKIDAVLNEHKKDKIRNLTILDIGSGVGEIALFFAVKNNVYAVDVENQLSQKAIESNVNFKLVTSEQLPFPDMNRLI